MLTEHVHIILFLPQFPTKLHETDFVFIGIITPAEKNGKGSNRVLEGGNRWVNGNELGRPQKANS